MAPPSRRRVIGVGQHIALLVAVSIGITIGLSICQSSYPTIRQSFPGGLPSEKATDKNDKNDKKPQQPQQQRPKGGESSRQLATTSVSPALDPYKFWSRRNQVSLETIAGVAERVDNPGACRNTSFHFTSMNGTSSMEQLAAAVHRKLRSGDRKIIVAVLGDSVAEDPNGFVEALDSYLSTSPLLNFEFEVRNLAKGGTGSRYTFLCNDLRGDEDIVMFETVRVFEDAILDLVESLVKAGFGVLLIGWRTVAEMEEWNRYDPMKKTAETLNIPFININPDKESLRTCLPSNANSSQTEQELLYRDETHPNRLGEVTISTMIGRTIEWAVNQYVPSDLQIETAGLVALRPKTLSNYDGLCFGRLECTDDEPQEIGVNRCLHVTRSDGFQLGRTTYEDGRIRKRWWEGLRPGNVIEFHLDAPCTEIVLFHSLRVTNGMVMITIDGQMLDQAHQQMSNGKLPQGILDGWYEGLSWLPRERGFLIEAVIAHDLEPVPHTVKLEVLNTTNSDDGTYKFDFSAVACKK